MSRYWSFLISIVLFEQVHQASTFCFTQCRTDQDCHGSCRDSSHIPVCDWVTFIFERELCCVCKAATCSSDTDCSGHSCNSGYVSKCNSQHNCHCERKPTCTLDINCSNHCASGYTATCSNGQCHCQRVATCSSDADCSGQSCNSGFVSKCNSQNQCQCLLKSTCSVDTDCSNRCISGYTATCSNGHCQCHAHKESTQMTRCSFNSDCAHYHCSFGRSSYCRTTFLDGHCDCLGASAHCSRNSDCANLQCSSGHTPVCSLSTHSCHCQTTCKTHHDCSHMTCRHGYYLVCSAAQNNTKTCVCKSTCSTQDECTNYGCSSQYKSYCQSGHCHCAHRCSSDSYCSHYGHCAHSSRQRCSTFLGNICVCEECVHDSECSNFHCQPYHSPICKNNSCSCKADPVDGIWSQWESWTTCSVTCGHGRQTRERSCTNPAPARGGLPCSGNGSEERNCSQISSCRIDGGWSDWVAWSICSVSCGGGTHTRARMCGNPSPSNGGSNCVGDVYQTHTCATAACGVDGGWSDWMAWSICSVSCGGGMQTRARMCGNPSPSNGGSNCVGDVYQTQTCATAACGGLACPTCDHNLVCAFNNTCDSSETCMIRSYLKTRFTVHCSKKEDCAFEQSNLNGEIYCCDDHSCIQRYLGID
nr:A disintegrin and metalloproteinase with thrombospondin motifs adt-1-like isoform X3 [Crassostrea gigas]